MNRDLQLAAGRGFHVLGERDEVLAVRIVGRIGGRQIPFGLRGGRRGKRDGARERQPGGEFETIRHGNALFVRVSSGKDIRGRTITI